jgi:hypothetical protein
MWSRFAHTDARARVARLLAPGAGRVWLMGDSVAGRQQCCIGATQGKGRAKVDHAIVTMYQLVVIEMPSFRHNRSARCSGRRAMGSALENGDSHGE